MGNDGIHQPMNYSRNTRIYEESRVYEQNLKQKGFQAVRSTSIKKVCLNVEYS